MKMRCDDNCRATLAVALVGFALIVVTLLTTAFIPSSLVRAAGPGRISGQLLDGTKNNAPVAGQSVTLQMAQGDTARDLTNVTTDTQGAFSFIDLDINKTINYAVYTRYQGAQYFTGLIDLSTKPVQQIKLTVYEATTSTAAIAIVRATILIHKPDAQVGVFTVSEVYAFKNLGSSTYVGTLQASSGMPNALRFSLPKGARKVSLSTGFDGYQAIAVDRGFATDAAIPPGDTQFAFSFEVPYTASSYDFNYTVVYPTVQLLLLVPPDLHASSSILNSQGLTSAGQDPYQLFQTKTLRPGAEIHAQIEGFPVAAAASNVSTLNSGQFWLVGVLLAMLAIVFVTWFFLKRTVSASSRGAINRAPTDPDVPMFVGARFIAPRGEASTLSSQEREQVLLQELLDMDKAYEAGKIKKVEYQERRARTKAQLRTLMSTETAKIGKKTVQKSNRSSSAEAPERNPQASRISKTSPDSARQSPQEAP